MITPAAQNNNSRQRFQPDFTPSIEEFGETKEI